MEKNALLAIDPGNVQSGWVLLDEVTRRPLQFGKDDNDDLLAMIRTGQVEFARATIEMIASYGMAVGAEVFETCVWIGRFYAAVQEVSGQDPELVFRHAIKVHHCHSTAARDANIRQALVDRFAHGTGNYGKGTKRTPGWFYGFRADVWAAYALAVYSADTHAAAAAA
jgi:hypothetical protein